MKIIAVCGSFHKEEIESMLEFARDEAGKHSIDCLLYTSDAADD